MMGPTGIAALYGRRQLLERLSPPFVGGEGIVDSTYQSYAAADLPDRFESGLQHYAGIIGAAAAIRTIERIGWPIMGAHITSLNQRLTGALRDIDGVTLIGPPSADKRGSIVNFHIAGLDSLEVAQVLSHSDNIMIRAGKHCAHSWYNASGTPDSLRASMYVYNTAEEMDLLARRIGEIAREFR